MPLLDFETNLCFAQTSNHSHDPITGNCLLSSPPHFKSLGSEELSALSSPTTSSPSWLSSASLDSPPSPTSGIKPHLDLFTPFRPQYSDKQYICTRLLDVLLTKCNGRVFKILWAIRLLRHEAWSRQLPAEHEMQLMTYDHGSSEGAWPLKFRALPGSDAAATGTRGTKHIIPKQWHDNFIIGCKATIERTLEHHALSVINKGSWGSKPSIQILADEFRNQYCEQYSEPWLSDRAKMVVPFLVTVRSCFEKKLGPYVAHCFQSCVEVSTMNLFNVMWKSHQPCCVISISTSSSDIKNALLLARYLGALFRSSTISYYNLQVAISILVNNLRVIEQIQALYYLTVEAGDKLWKTAESRVAMECWTRILEAKVAGTIITSSASGNKRVVNTELDRWVKHFTVRVRQNIKKHHQKEIVESFRT